MKPSLIALPLIAAIASTPVFSAKLHNKDSTAHDITIKCSSTSTGSIQANTVRDLGSGPCTVTVKSTGSSASAGGKDMLVIKDGKIKR
jgi:hypothetical protein